MQTEAALAPDTAPDAAAEPENTLSADLFNKAVTARPRIVGVVLASVGVQAYVKQLPPDQRKALAPTADDRKKPEEHRGRVLAACVCYADGSQKFDAAAMEVIGRAQPGELYACYLNACHLNGHLPLPEKALSAA